MVYQLFAGSLEDLLPVRTEPKVYAKKHLIYTGGSPAIYYVHSGIVRTLHTTEAGRDVHHDFFPQGELFGESCLSPAPFRSPERAIAHTNAVISTWTADQFAELALSRRQLVDALVGFMLKRQARTLERIERAERLPVKARLWAALLDTAERIGTPETDFTRGVALPGITHEVLASMVGTSREIVTQHMNEFRFEQKLVYSRKRILLFRLPQMGAAA